MSESLSQLSQSRGAIAPGKRAVRRAFTGLWAGLFATAIGWLAAVAATFFWGLAKEHDMSIYGMHLVFVSGAGFQLMFDGANVALLLAAGAAIGLVGGLLLHQRKG